ncbi:MFS transporter [Ciceribacter sp. L1K23]|uniref:RsmB/NOP family class I SAM-dependent RNA methyltransferase n=1 Tax=Ciceribacter sp. L1K23 TaxID=2820276 RepID=UPI001B82E477|nr:RsmB/NOP family class I SAM-dependent RNA methyltransferase [Ciceribacter sp. L1K23]MBR0557672.1 MFS transporter [Ciceribacter sp. L1K23]
MNSNTKGNVASPKGRGTLPEKAGLEARATAARLLAAVVDRKTSLDGMLDPEHGNPAYLALDPTDRGLVRAIVQSSLRYLPRIEAILDRLLATPLPAGARSLQHVLVTGAAQILYLDIPDHSAVDLAVEMANRDPRNRRFAKLVNAILRRVSRDKAILLEEVSGIACVPSWFEQRLVDAYGRERAISIAEAILEPAAIDLTVKQDPEVWAARLEGRLLPTGSLRLQAFKGAVSELDGYDDGAWWVQDAAACLPAQLFGKTLAGRRVADLCAAPGGKTAQLLLAGAEVVAVEQSANRLRRMQTNLSRLGLSAQTVKSDLLALDAGDGFDAVLLDAPCSSTGTIRRHPDVLWTKSPEDIGKLAEVQGRLLRHAMTLVRPGGLLVFSNCSLDPLEGEMLVENVLSNRSDFAREPVLPENWPGLETAITAKGEFRTTPDMLLPAADGIAGGMDGFYACVLRRLS